MTRLLDQINSPADLKKMSVEQFPALAEELRAEIIRVIAKNGGHLGASLGAVELAIALHYVFDAPKDKIVWDTGHQAHGHKILTDRREAFETIRLKGGISGFPNRAESPYDAFGVGHASTSISAALGMAVARDLAGDNYRVVAVIGDGALTGGMAFEAINNAGNLKTDLLVILNDNKMAIAKNVGALSKYLTAVTSGRVYNRLEADVWELLGVIPRLGGKARRLARKIKESIKTLVVPGMLFEELGFRYFGPVDGHNVEFLVKTLKDLANLKGPILLHVITEKGKGFAYAGNDSTRCHGVNSFDKIPGDREKKQKNARPSYTEVFSKTMVRLASENPRIVGITAAMPDGTGLKAFGEAFPDRFFDVGIAEQHAMTFAAGLASQGMVPVAAIYSTFLQRAFDQVIHDVGLQNLPVRIVMDRAGLVGDDGPTHHGTFDVGYLRMVPNFVVMAPKDENELQHMLKTMVEYDRGPSALRMPRGYGLGVKLDEELVTLPVGKAEVVRDGRDVVLLAYGHCVHTAAVAAAILGETGLNPVVVNARFAKPLDTALLDQLVRREPYVITIEEHARAGGYGSAVLEYLAEGGYEIRRIKTLGIPDRYMMHAPQADQLAEIGLTPENIAHTVLELVGSGKRLVKAATGNGD
jgi:1-deoxy-D-xylulose-5-phosphate synthase